MNNGKAPELQLWTAATPNGWKISILLEELIEAGVVLPQLDVRSVDLFSGEQFSEAFSAINPNQKIPALVHGNISMMESCSILLYLAETFPSPLLPQGSSRWSAIQWVFWQAANLGPTFGNKLSYTRYMDSVPEAQKVHPLQRFNAEAQRLLGVLDKQLQSGGPYLCGENFTVADIACYPWIRGWKWSKIDITGHQYLVAWLARVSARPGVERGVTYGAPKGQAHQWNADIKEKYRRAGSRIASTQNITGAARGDNLGDAKSEQGASNA
ncbi:MAG: glutathione S-transferase family protein [Cellvibrionaceae bacterium]